MSGTRDEILKKFTDEVDERGPGGKHARLQKLCGKYLARNGGPLKRELKDIHAEQKVRLGGKKKNLWPADILADWGSFTEVVEVQSVSPARHVTVEYRGLDDANEKLDYLEEMDMIAPTEARLVRTRVGDAARAGVNATSFWFEPTRKHDLYRLVGKGWNLKCESELERKFRLAGKSDSVVSFCVPHDSYRKVLEEIRDDPEMKVGLIYPFVERDGHLRIAGAIPVFQGIDLKEYRNAGGLSRMAEPREKRANLFAYGTLMDSDFVEKLCGRAVEMVGARLEGYAKEKPEGWSYFVAAKQNGSAIEGKLLLDLTSDELKMLGFWEEYRVSKKELLKQRDKIWELVKQDRLEGFSRISRYRRVLESVVTDGGGNPMETLVYVQR